MGYTPQGFGSGAAGTPGHAIKANSGSAAAQRANLNFLLADQDSISVADDTLSNETEVTLPSRVPVPLTERAAAWVTFEGATHSASFNTTGVTLTGVNADVITTTAAHGLSTGDAVTFRSGGALPLPLVAGTRYYVRALSTTTFKVYPTADDATNDTNAIDLTSQGSGTNPAHRVSKVQTISASNGVDYVYWRGVTGAYAVVFSAGTWADANYVVAGTGQFIYLAGDMSAVPFVGVARDIDPTTALCPIGVWYASGSTSPSGLAVAPKRASLVFFGNRPS